MKIFRRGLGTVRGETDDRDPHPICFVPTVGTPCVVDVAADVVVVGVVAVVWYWPAWLLSFAGAARLRLPEGARPGAGQMVSGSKGV